MVRLVIAAAALLLVGCSRPLAPVPLPPAEQPVPAATSSAAWVQPLDRAIERVTKKRFGTQVTPQSSPVQPERFSGYHTGVDYETFSDEADEDVSVRAICSGPLLTARTASGYGGVVVQSCELHGEAVTVAYGHLRITSVAAKVGDRLDTGELLGVLGTGGSGETDGERKHLHLGIHRGVAVNLRGYVASQAALADWVDPAEVIS